MKEEIVIDGSINYICYPLEPNGKDLEMLYDICNEIFKDNQCFYTHEEAINMKKNNTKIFI